MIGVARVGFPAWQAHPDVWLIAALVSAGYFIAIRRVGPALVGPGEPVVERRHVVSFVIAIAGFVIASDYPIHDLAERYLFSVHMFQHLLYTMLVAPMLVRACPPWLARYVLTKTRTLGVVRWFARFFPAVMLFNVVLVVTHVPAMVSLSLRYGLVHFSLHVVLVLSGIVLWMPVLSPIPEVPRFQPPIQMLYLFTQSVVPTIPAAFLAYGEHTVYRDYDKFDRVYGISAHSDQVIAGLIMKTGAGLILWAVITIVFFRWFAAEEAPMRGPRTKSQPAPVDLDREILGLPQP